MSHDDSQPRYSDLYSSTYLTGPQSSNTAVGQENGPFDPGNTPPLIFAFIAIGFTVFGLIIAIIYKRRLSVEKPKLWDVRIPPNQYASDEDQMKNVTNDWDTFVPLSASLVYPYSPPSVHPPHQYVQGHAIRPISWESPENRLYFRHPPPDTNLRVAVMIAMPKQPRWQDSRPSRTRPENDFHVGVTEVKWTG